MLIKCKFFHQQNPNCARNAKFGAHNAYKMLICDHKMIIYGHKIKMFDYKMLTYMYKGLMHECKILMFWDKMLTKYKFLYFLFNVCT